jgi:hypothetical protein
MSQTYKHDPDNPARAYTGKVSHNNRRRARQYRGRQRTFQVAASNASLNQPEYDELTDYDYEAINRRYTNHLVFASGYEG